MSSPTVLVTGGNGFIGRQVVSDLVARGFHVRAASRRASPAQATSPQVQAVQIGDIAENGDWTDCVEGIDTVIHLAAHVHDMRGDRSHTLDAYHGVNVRGTETLAAAAAARGIRRFVYVSSIKAMGEHRPRPWSVADVPHPADGYGRSKLAAEQALQAIAAQSGMEFVIVRPPLVYGPGVKANFLAMLRWIDRGYPLPLGSVESRRSLVSVWNLADLLIRTIQHPRAAGRVFLVSDGQDLSLVDLLGRLARAMNRTPRNLRIPPGLLLAVARMVGMGPQVERLVTSLQVDMVPTCRDLDWQPPLSVDRGLERTVEWYRSQGNRP